MNHTFLIAYPAQPSFCDYQCIIFDYFPGHTVDSSLFNNSLFNLQEVIRIKNEHPDDKNCILNDRVKGRLKVTRAFGAGFLKQVLWMYLIYFTFCIDCLNSDLATY